MGKIEIFKVDLVDHASGARLPFSGGRELNGYFFLDFTSFYLPLFLEQAAALARAVDRLAWRLQRTTPKAGPVWRRNLGSGAGDSFRLEFGLTDERRIYVEAGALKVHCDDAQSDVLLAVLSRYAADIRFVAARSPGEGMPVLAYREAPRGHPG
jgi:hypothetical protein